MNYHLQKFIFHTRYFSGKLIILGLVIWVASFFFNENLPDRNLIVPELNNEPIQTETEDPEFTKVTSENIYNIEPLYDYEVAGLVVSQSHSESWLDYYHDRLNDDINIQDLCLIWGDNVKTNFYQNIEFTSGESTCYYSYRGYTKGEVFNHNQLSNFHLLTISTQLKQKLRSIGVGDQILLKGYLANYTKGASNKPVNPEGSSSKTIFISDIEILKESNVLHRRIREISFFLTVISLVTFIVFTIIYPYKPVKAKKTYHHHPKTH